MAAVTFVPEMVVLSCIKDRLHYTFSLMSLIDAVTIIPAFVLYRMEVDGGLQHLWGCSGLNLRAVCS
jgi:hypothetical protein